jgi:Domain of unknown function (DUF4349)
MTRIRLAGNKLWVLGAGVLALVVAGALVAVLDSTASDDSSSSSVAQESGRGGVADSGGGADLDGGASLAAPSASKQIGPVPPTTPGSPPVPGSPRIVRSGELRVNVGRNGFDVAFDRVAAIASAHGGFVAASSTSTIEDARAGELTVRVPADRFDAARRDLAGLGQVEHQALRGEDVSGQLVDFDARLRSLTAQEEALRGLLGRATAVGEVLQVQSSLFEVRQQIEQLAAQKQNLEQAASLSTLQVSVFEPGAGFGPRPVEEDKSLAHAFRRAVDGALAVVGGMIVVIGWAVPVVALGLVVWGISRLVGRRRPRSAARPDAPVPAAP